MGGRPDISSPFRLQALRSMDCLSLYSVRCLQWGQNTNKLIKKDSKNNFCTDNLKNDGKNNFLYTLKKADLQGPFLPGTSPHCAPGTRCRTSPRKVFSVATCSGIISCNLPSIISAVNTGLHCHNSKGRFIPAPARLCTLFPCTLRLKETVTTTLGSSPSTLRDWSDALCHARFFPQAGLCVQGWEPRPAPGIWGDVLEEQTQPLCSRGSAPARFSPATTEILL